MRRSKGEGCIDCGAELPKYHTTRCAECGEFYRRARRGGGLPASKVYPRACAVCSTSFIGRKSNAAFCTDACELRSPSRKRSEERRGLARLGATVEQYHERHAQQGGLCAICGLPTTTVRRLHFDHDHATGQLRDLLCHHCNTGLGAFKDDPSLLLAAVAYLARHTDSRAVTGPDGISTTTRESTA